MAIVCNRTWKRIRRDAASTQSHLSCFRTRINGSPVHLVFRRHIDGLVQDCSNYSASAMELLQSCTEPSIYTYFMCILIQIQQNSLLGVQLMKRQHWSGLWLSNRRQAPSGFTHYSQWHSNAFVDFVTISSSNDLMPVQHQAIIWTADDCQSEPEIVNIFSLQWCWMSGLASQITDNSGICSTVCSGGYQRKHQSARYWPFGGESTC